MVNSCINNLKINKFIFIILILAFLFLAVSLSAQNAKAQTDRPPAIFDIRTEEGAIFQSASSAMMLLSCITGTIYLGGEFKANLLDPSATLGLGYIYSTTMPLLKTALTGILTYGSFMQARHVLNQVDKYHLSPDIGQPSEAPALASRPVKAPEPQLDAIDSGNKNMQIVSIVSLASSLISLSATLYLLTNKQKKEPKK